MFSIIEINLREHDLKNPQINSKLWIYAKLGHFGKGKINFGFQKQFFLFS